MIDSAVLGLTTLPGPDELPTVEERTAYLMGLMLDQAPSFARPILRSMLLPKLETLSSESLAATLQFLQDVILPWVLTGDTGGAPAVIDEFTGEVVSDRG